ncbi:MAG: hypothetical protein KGI28_10045, partial [Thaumarchaeota archaeon]|nr:hypothetical protein [Nitrososphaerota archaeon]
IELLESIEKLSKKRDKHLTSLEHKKRFIMKLKVHNFTTILSKEHHVRYADDDKSLEKDMIEHPENYEVPISFSICVICNTLVKDDRSRRNLSLNDYILDKETESRYSGFI